MTRSTQSPASTKRANGQPLADPTPLWTRDKHTLVDRIGIGRREADALRRLRLAAAQAGDLETSVRVLAKAWGAGRWLECGCRDDEEVGPLLSVAYLESRQRYYLRRMTGAGRQAHASGCPFGVGDALVVPGGWGRGVSAHARPRVRPMLRQILDAARVGVRPGGRPSTAEAELGKLRAAVAELARRPSSAWASGVGVGMLPGRSLEDGPQHIVVVAHQVEREALWLVGGARLQLRGGVSWDQAVNGIDGPFVVLVEVLPGGRGGITAFAQPVVSRNMLAPVYSNEERGLWSFAEAASAALARAGLGPEFRALDPGRIEPRSAGAIGLEVGLRGRRRLSIELVWKGDNAHDKREGGARRFRVGKSGEADPANVGVLLRYCFAVLREEELR